MEKDDKGHDLLVDDIRDIYDNVMTFEYHDFKNDKYDSPKAVLQSMLLKMAQATVNGKYDN